MTSRRGKKKSAKRSGSGAAPLRPVFVDHNLSSKSAREKIAVRYEYIALKDEFDVDAKDVDWLPVVGEKQYLVVTVDVAMQRTKVERDEILKHGVFHICIRAAKLTYAEKVDLLVERLPLLQAVAAAAPWPQMVRISPSGSNYLHKLNDDEFEWRPLRQKHTNPKTWRKMTGYVKPAREEE